MTTREGQDPQWPDFNLTLQAARNGDSSALGVLYEQFSARVGRIVHHSLSRDLRTTRPWLRARISTGDVVQEVFRSVLKDISTFRGESEGAFVGYLSMLVRNRLIDTIRHHEAACRDGRRTLQPEGWTHGIGSPTSSDDVVTDDELELFSTLIALFPEREQILLRARLEDQATFQELADQLGYSSSHAARRAFLAAQTELVSKMRRAQPRKPIDPPGHDG